MSATTFSFEPLFLALAVVAAALYWRTARTDRPPRWRSAAFATGLLLIAASLNSPLETIGAHYLLLIHLLQNALIADIAPLLVLLGLALLVVAPGIIARLGHDGASPPPSRMVHQLTPETPETPQTPEG